MTNPLFSLEPVDRIDESFGGIFVRHIVAGEGQIVSRDPYAACGGVGCLRARFDLAFECADIDVWFVDEPEAVAFELCCARPIHGMGAKIGGDVRH